MAVLGVNFRVIRKKSEYKILDSQFPNTGFTNTGFPNTGLPTKDKTVKTTKNLKNMTI